MAPRVFGVADSESGVQINQLRPDNAVDRKTQILGAPPLSSSVHGLVEIDLAAQIGFGDFRGEVWEAAEGESAVRHWPFRPRNQVDRAAAIWESPGPPLTCLPGRARAVCVLVEVVAAPRSASALFIPLSELVSQVSSGRRPPLCFVFSPLCFVVAWFHLRPRIVGHGLGRVLPQVVWRGMSWIQEEAEGKGAVPVGGVVIVLFRCSMKGMRGPFVQPAVGGFIFRASRCWRGSYCV